MWSPYCTSPGVAAATSGCGSLKSACAVQVLSGVKDVQPCLVTGTIQHAPEVRVQRIHLPCGHAVEEALLGDMFDEVRRGMHSSMNLSTVVALGLEGVSAGGQLCTCARGVHVRSCTGLEGSN